MLSFYIILWLVITVLWWDILKNSQKSASYWIKSLNLKKHPEGGFFREFYKSSEWIPLQGLPDRFKSPRTFCTSIYFLLRNKDFSAFHRINQDELWHFYAGSPLQIHIFSRGGVYNKVILGSDASKGHSLQIRVPHGSYFAADHKHKRGYSLVGCTVAPGFEFEDFEMPSRRELLKKYPTYKGIIERLTRK